MCASFKERLGGPGTEWVVHVYGSASSIATFWAKADALSVHDHKVSHLYYNLRYSLISLTLY